MWSSLARSQLGALVQPGPVHLALAHAGAHDERAGHPVAVHEELPCAAPPEVVHRDHGDGTGLLGRPHEPGAEGLERVEVDDVGLQLREVGPEVGLHAGVVEVGSVRPADEPLDRDPPHGQAGHVLLPRLEGRAGRVERARVHGHVPPAGDQRTGLGVGHERAAAHEVGREVGGDDEEPGTRRRHPALRLRGAAFLAGGSADCSRSSATSSARMRVRSSRREISQENCTATRNRNAVAARRNTAGG